MKFSIAGSLYARRNYLPPERDINGVATRVAKGSFWSGIEVAATTCLQLVRSMIFARLLMPADFGVLGLATVFTEFVLIFANFGFNASVIYQKDVDKRDLATSWWGNFFVDSTIAIFCICFALLSSRFSDQQQTSQIICLLAVQFLIVSFGSINMALMRRLFMFRQLTICKLLGAILTFLTSWMLIVFTDLGVFGLVFGMLIGNLFLTCAYFYCMPWFPSLAFSWSHLRRHLHYGGWFLGVNVGTYVNGNIDKAIVGTYLNVTQLGFYEYASNIPLMVASKLSQVLNSVLLPAFSSLQDDVQALGTLLKRVYRYNALLIYPILCGIGLVAPDFVLVAYGEKWLPIIDPLRLFCLFGLLRIFINPFYALCNGVGKPQLPFKWIIIYLPVNVILLFWGIDQLGLVGAVAARLVLPVFMSFTMGWQVLKMIKVSYKDVLCSIWPALFACLLMALSVISVQFLLSDLGMLVIVRLFLQVITGALVYFCVIFFAFREDVDFVVRQFRK